MNKKVILGLGLVILIGAAIWGFNALNSKTPSPPAKIIGVVGYLEFLDTPGLAGLKDGLESLNRIEGRDYVIEYTYAEGQLDKLDENAAILAAKNVDLLFAISNESGPAAYKATQDIPIVFIDAFQAVEYGIAKSLRSSETNVTGVLHDYIDASAKRYEYTRRIFPNVKRLGTIWPDFANPTATLARDEFEKQASQFGFELVKYRIESPPGPEARAEYKEIVDNLKPGEIDAFMLVAGAITHVHQDLLIPKAKELGIPLLSMANGESSVFDYGPNFYGNGVQAATMVDKILFKGIQPANIPIEFQNVIAFSVNNQMARELGITIPRDILELATDIIE